MSTTSFYCSNLRTARLCKGLTLDDLAGALDYTRQNISRIETGITVPSYALISQLADLLDVTPAFFSEVHIAPIAEEQVHFRRLSVTKAQARQSVIARGQLLRLVCAEIESYVDLPPVSILPTVPNDMEAIERAAEKFRFQCGLGFGPVSHVTRVVENSGAVVTSLPNLGKELDALSLPGIRPVIVRRASLTSGSRIRFDIAHELAHLILHDGIVTGDRVTEAQAHRFASAFLLPRSSFVKELIVRSNGQLQWTQLPVLKERWGVSKAAIIMRAKNLSLISEVQAKALFIRLRNGGEAQAEHDDHVVAIEYPELISKALALVAPDSKSADALCSRLCIKKPMLEWLGINVRAPEPEAGTKQTATIVRFTPRQLTAAQ